MQNPASALLSQVSSSGGGLPGRLDLERDSRRSYFGGGISGSWAWEAGFGMPDFATPSCLAFVAAHPLGQELGSSCPLILSFRAQPERTRGRSRGTCCSHARVPRQGLANP